MGLILSQLKEIKRSDSMIPGSGFSITTPAQGSRAAIHGIFYLRFKPGAAQHPGLIRAMPNISTL